MPAETRSLTDTVVAITGAGSGIGAATARLLVEAGARVVLARAGPSRSRPSPRSWAIRPSRS